MSEGLIREFKGRYSFLSNFHPAIVRGPGALIYPTVEHAYQAAKSDRPEDWRHIRDAARPGEAKRRGRHVRLIYGWDEQRLDVMEVLLHRKFKSAELRAKLLVTRSDLEEGNRWHDTFWGIDLLTGKGFNHLGKLLMKIREELRQ